LIGKQAVAVFKQDRLAGPIFRKTVRRARAGERVGFPVFRGGFAAVEAEFLLKVGRAAPADQRDWTTAEAQALVGAVHVGIETAGSPLATINDLGPAAIVADFGNNAGLIVGPELPNWRTTPVEQWRCETFVDDTLVGRGHGGVPPGGCSSRSVLARFCASLAPLVPAIGVDRRDPGVHEVVVGQAARVSFGEAGEILCRAEPFAAGRSVKGDK
jgi:2-keto-4-pentenoate hydratase